MICTVTIDATNGSPDRGTHSRVAMLRGAPAFLINGKPHCGLSYMTYENNYSTVNGQPALPKHVKLFADAGCDLYTFVIDLGGLYGYTGTLWPKRDRWDFSQVDAIAHLVVGAIPPDAKLVLQLYVDTPEWWAKENSEELFRLSNGTTDFGEKLFALPRRDNLPSIASAKWRADVKLEIETLIDHVDQSDYGNRVMGYQVCGQKTEEWYHWSMNTEILGDYSAPMQSAFRAWLKERYENVANLRSAWGQPTAAFDTVQIPSQEERYGNRSATFRDPSAEQHVLDFHRFWSDIMADTIAYFAKVVKDKTQHRKVVGAFYAYTFEFAQLGEDAGHLALRKLLQCPDIDFIMSPSSYCRRELKGGQSCFRAPILSLTLHRKMYWSDFDPASFKFYEKDQAEYAQWKPWLAVTDTAEEYTYMIRRELGNALANGVNMAHFDLHGGYYDDPLLVEEVRRCRSLRESALQTDRRSCAEILLVVDEDSQHFLTFRNDLSTPLLSGQLAEMPFVAPYDAVLLDDLDRVDTSGYKLVLVLNAFKLDSTQRRLLGRKLKSGGKHVIWLYAPGYFRSVNGRAEVSGIAEITSLQVSSRHRPSETIFAVFDKPSRQQIPLLNGEQFVVNDPLSEVLAKRSDAEGEPVVVSKRLKGWTSIYSAVAPLPRTVLRLLAVRAGVHLYHDNPEDSVYANRRYLTLAASTQGGPRTLRLRRRATVVDLISGETVATEANDFAVDFKPSETRMFALH
ncbi:MAG: beta-galactosidase [Armatimonadetes bacterium]|nr:beta-galactosidase [Armatimonadota bacterium]